jgi:limonene 1,2-monooxygenase
MTPPLKFGAFIPPIQNPAQNPTLALERVLEMVEFADRIGFDEAWFGEHHNGGWELISCPELFIAAAAGRTKHIKLATGVTTLPYHHPFLVAERMVMLDHLTRGRVIFGAGPGSLSWDAHIFGLDYSQNRRKLAEGLDAIMQLLTSDKPVTIETDWFKMRDAQLQLKPYTYPHFEVTTAGTASPSGPRQAGKHGISLLTIAASSPAGFDALRNTWEIVEAEAKAHGKTVDRSNWRLVSFYHIADTEEQARKDVRYGLPHVLRYLSTTTPLAKGLTDITNVDKSIDELNASGLMVIGTADRLIEHLKAFDKQTGGFGGFLGFGTDLADRTETLRSLELVMRDVAPVFQGQSQRLQSNFAHVQQLGSDWSEQVEKAQTKAQQDWEKGKKP